MKQKFSCDSNFVVQSIPSHYYDNKINKNEEDGIPEGGII